MSSLIEELHRRETAAREEAAGLRREIDSLNELVVQTEERRARLEIARETVAEILGEADVNHVEAPSATVPVRAEAAEPVSVESASASPIGVLTVGFVQGGR